ncbi:hypothetical protein B0H14DRAFT_3628869 [Mycena olivaceomarginata]|nr:hypothetical protein B0H14DRAFT_3628869 [Mycena olivaceomarginata]
MSSFGATFSSGIQDVAAILSLFGTEEGRGGYLYAAITPVSIFGSLGPAKAAVSIMFASVPFVGARTLRHLGFEAKGDALAITMLDGDRYVAERRLLKLLNKHYVRSAQNLSIDHPALPYRPFPFPLRPWNLKLLLASLFVAWLGVTPYIHFSLHHTSSHALTLFFPFCRVVGGLLCVFPGQLILQYRIEKILKQRILFKGINDLLNDWNVKIPTRYIHPWNESPRIRSTPMAKTRNAAPFIDLLSQVLHLPAKSTPAELALAMKPYLTDTWGWLTMLSALLLGFLMTLVGYVGCFTIVQNSSVPSDTYIWLGAEAVLAAIRLLTWASNPSWDDSDGLWLKVHPRKSKPLQHTLGTDENPPGTFKIIHETRFWEALTAYAGPVNINEMRKIHGFRHWYSWIRRKTAQGSTEMLYIILEGKHTVLCRMREDTQDIEFHRADLTINPGHAMQLETLEEDHELLKWPSEFRISVFEHYNFILSSKGGDCVPIRVSWPLSESSVSGPTDIAIGVPDGGNGSHRPRDGERATPVDDSDNTQTWSRLQGTVGSTLSGTQLTYTEFSVCFRIISNNATSRGLHRRLSTYLSGYTQSIRQQALALGSDRDLAYFYNERWRTYSRGALSLNRLFRPINSNLVKVEHQRSEDTVDTVKNMAFAQWNGNVLQALSVRLSVNPAMAIEVERTLASFMSRDLSPYDLRHL